MHNSRYNGAPMLSPIGRNAKRLENTSMTNLLSPSKNNKSILSSTHLTPIRTTPRYALSKPMDSSPRSPLTSTQFNSNSTFYTPSRVNKSPPVENTVRESTPTHQAKYGRPGLFPVVHFFQKKVPVITPKQNSCVIKLSSNGPGLFDDAVDNVYESQNIVNTSQTAEPSTRSVLDALKEISRKRIHGGDSYDKEKDKSNEYSKRNREEDTSSSPKSGATSPQQATKRICVVDPIYASNTSSFCLKNNKRKLYECWLPTNETKNKKVMSVETQTQSPATPTEETTPTTKCKSTKCVAEQNESSASTETQSSLTSTEKSQSSTNNEADRTKNTQEPNETSDDAAETKASAQRAWDEKIYAIQKKNKLAIVLSRIAGEEPKLIPVPRLWDKTADVTDSNSNQKSSIAITRTTVTSGGASLILNGPSVLTTKTNEDNQMVDKPLSVLSTTVFGESTAVTTTTASVTAPISSSSITAGITSASTDGSPAKEAMSTGTFSATSASLSSLPLSTSSSTPSFILGSPKINSVTAMSTITIDPSKTTNTTATGSGFAFGSNLSAVTTTTANILGSMIDNSPSHTVSRFDTAGPAGNTPTTAGFKFGGQELPKPVTVTSTAANTFAAAFGSPASGITTGSPFALKPSLSVAPSSVNATTMGFTSPTLKTSAFSSPGGAGSKPTFGSTLNGAIPSLVATSNPPIAFGSTGTPAFGTVSAKPETVSFATAFGLNPTSGGVMGGTNNTTLSKSGGISFDTGATPSVVSAPSAGGFSFKPSEAGKTVGSSGGLMFGGAGANTTTTSAAGGFSDGASLFGRSAEKPSATPIFGATGTIGTANTTFGGASSATTTGFGVSVTPVVGGAVGTAKPSFGGGFGSTTITATTAPPSFGASTGTGAFGSTNSGGGATFGSTTSTGIATSTAAVPTFGGFGATSTTQPQPPSFGSSGTSGQGQQPPPAFGAATTASKPSFGSVTGNTAGAPGGGGFSFGSSNNPPPPSYAASVGASTATSTAANNGGAPSFGFGAAAGTTTGTGGFGASSTPSFGSAVPTLPAFGSSATTTAPPAFGAPTTTSSVFGFGGGVGSTSNASNAKPTGGFGATPTPGGFGFNSTSAPVAAAGTTSTFGQGAAPSGPTGPVFSFGNNAPPTTTSAFAFGQSAPATTTPAFGSSGFGSSANTFGSPATTQSTGFGTAPNVNPFGKSTSSAFGAPSSSTPSAFGATATPAPPAFGATPSGTTFGATAPQPSNASTFGSAFGQPSAQTNFNSSFGAPAPALAPSANNTFAFGGAGSTTSGFGSAPNPNSQPPPFGSNAPPAGFNFKSPTAVSGEQKPVFAFGGPEQPKPAAGGFNFSAGNASPAPTPNFGAAFGAATPQQPGMFSIGTGAPAKRVLRAKRRT